MRVRCVVQVYLDVVYNHVGTGDALIHTSKNDFFILGKGKV